MKCLSVKVTSTIVCYGYQYLRSLHRNYGLLKVLIYLVLLYFSYIAEVWIRNSIGLTNLKTL